MKTFTIKPLEWDCISAVDGSFAIPMDTVSYHVRENQFGWGWQSNDKMFNNANSEDHAKAACESDWQERIGAALVEIDADKITSEGINEIGVTWFIKGPFVEMNCCGFQFDKIHVHKDGNYTCPCCDPKMDGATEDSQ